MNKENEKKIHDMLYDKSNEEVLKEIDNIEDSEFLYVYAFNYNWNNGFDIPAKIISKKSCDLSTALMIFYKADGIRYLMEKNNGEKNSDYWLKFIKSLYEEIISHKFQQTMIQFEPPLSKVQLYKLKKILNINENIFIQKFGVQDLDIFL